MKNKLKTQQDLSARQNISKEFKWRTHNQGMIRVSNMRTSHIANSLRMIWNHLCPEEMKIPGGNRWGGISEWDVEYLKNSVDAFILELENRGDLNAQQKNILEHVQTNKLSHDQIKKLNHEE